MALTAKQELFAKEYLVDLNATQAAIRAGYSGNTAKEIGCENLTKPNIAERIQKLMDERSKRLEITADMILAEYAKIGFSNITDYLKVKEEEIVVGMEGTPETGFTPVRQMVQVVRIFDTDLVDLNHLAAVSEIKQTKEGISLKLHDKKGALDSMARHKGMFQDKLEHSGQVTNKIDLSGLSVEDLKAYAAKRSTT